MLKIKGRMNPFAPVYKEAPVKTGITLRQAIYRYCETLEEQENLPQGAVKRFIKYCKIFLNGVSVDESLWDIYIVKAGDDIAVNVTPQGSSNGEKKNPWATVYQVAIAALAIVASAVITPLASSAAYGALTGALAGGGILFFGQLMYAQLFPYATKSAPEVDNVSGTPFQIGSVSNEVRPWNSVPVILGRKKVYPPMACQPYTVMEDDDQFWHAIFLWGYPDMEVDESTFKIGDTPVDDLQDSVECRTFIYPTQRPTFHWYDGTIVERPVSGTNSSGVPLNVQQYVPFTTGLEVNSLSLDLAFPGGLYKINEKGQTENLYLDVEIGYQPQGSSEWTTLGENQAVGEKAFPMPDRIYLDLADRVLTTGNFPDDPFKVLLYELAWSTSQVPDPSSEKNRTYTVYNYTAIDHRASDLKTKGWFNLSLGNNRNGQVKVSKGEYKFNSIRIVRNAKKTVIKTFHLVKDGELQKYNIRVRRITGERESGSTYYSDNVVWQLVREKRKETPIQFPHPVYCTEMRIKAGEQVSGNVDNFSGIIRSRIPDFDPARQGLITPSSRWVTAATSNPASLILYVLRGLPNDRRINDNMIDWESFEAFWKHCNEKQFPSDPLAKTVLDKGFEYNAYIESPLDIQQDLIPEIAAAGRGYLTQYNGKYGIAIDEEKSPVQYFTPANSWGFKSSRYFRELPHALKVAYFNEYNDYLSDECVICDKGYTSDSNAARTDPNLKLAELFETIQIPGVTNYYQTYAMASEYLAAARLRYETHTIEVDMEYLIAKRRDVVRVSHDILKVGLAYGRIKSLLLEDNRITGVEIEDSSTMTEDPDENGNTRLYGITIRSIKDDGTVNILERQVITEEGLHHTLRFSDPVNISISLDGSEFYPLKEGDMYTFGEYENSSEEYIISHIEPSEGLNATVTLIPYQPVIYGIDIQEVPDYEPKVSNAVAPKYVVPAMPVDLTVGEVMELRANEAAHVACLNWLPPVNSPVRASGYQLQYKHTDDNWSRLMSTTELGYEFLNLKAGDYEFRVRSVSDYGRTSDWASIEKHLDGDILPPNDVGKISTFYTDTINLLWEPVVDIRFIEYEIRFGDNWDNAQKMVLTEETQFPALMDGTYHIKAKTGNDIYSLNPSTINVQNARGFVENVIATYSEAPDWDGTLENLYIQNNGLIYQNINGEAGYYTVPETHQVKISAINRVMCSFTYKAFAFKDNNLRDIIDIRLSPNLRMAVTAGYEISVEIRCQAQNDVWGDWQPFQVDKKYIGKGFDFRIKMYSPHENIKIWMTDFTVTVDVPDKLITKHNIPLPAPAGADKDVEGHKWTFDQPFNAIPTLVGTVISTTGQCILTIDQITKESAMIYITDLDGNIINGYADLYAQGY